jgi:cyclopropane fatty-acyl-phospholipid synthase-like methyltransferase
MPSVPPIGRYEWLNFNAPMSDELADSIAARLARSSPESVVDIGCGWAEMLLRILASSPSAHGAGIDADDTVIARARSNAAARGLTDRVRFSTELPSGTAQYDVVVCIGADHIFGSQRAALSALYPMVRPGGRLLFGSGYWEQAPTDEQAAAVGLTPPDLSSLADLVDGALSVGFRLLDLRTASRREWEEFELGFLADWEEWLMRYGDSEQAKSVEERTDAHRTEYLRGWRDVLGFAYLILGIPGRSDQGV